MMITSCIRNLFFPRKRSGRRRARFAGFNETDYLNALEKVPTVTPAQLDGILDFLKNYADMLSDMGMPLENRGEGAVEDDSRAIGTSPMKSAAEKGAKKKGARGINAHA